MYNIGHNIYRNFLPNWNWPKFQQTQWYLQLQQAKFKQSALNTKTFAVISPQARAEMRRQIQLMSLIKNQPWLHIAIFLCSWDVDYLNRSKEYSWAQCTMHKAQCSCHWKSKTLKHRDINMHTTTKLWQGNERWHELIVNTCYSVSEFSDQQLHHVFCILPQQPQLEYSTWGIKSQLVRCTYA